MIDLLERFIFLGFVAKDLTVLVLAICSLIVIFRTKF